MNGVTTWSPGRVYRSARASPRSPRGDEGGHALARRRIRKSAPPRLHVVDEVLRPARGGNDARDGGGGEGPLQEELGPALPVERGGPPGQRLVPPPLGEGGLPRRG